LERILIESQQGKGSEVLSDLELLVLKYDKKEDRRISYLEFIDELTPKLA